MLLNVTFWWWWSHSFKCWSWGHSLWPWHLAKRTFGMRQRCNYKISEQGNQSKHHFGLFYWNHVSPLGPSAVFLFTHSTWKSEMYHPGNREEAGPIASRLKRWLGTVSMMKLKKQDIFTKKTKKTLLCPHLTNPLTKLRLLISPRQPLIKY